MGKLDDKSRQQSRNCSLQDCEVRLVTKDDKWCCIKSYRGDEPHSEAPDGYVVIIPYIPKKDLKLEGMEGYHIIRSKKYCGKLMLQVVKKAQAPQYGISANERRVSKKGKKKRNIHILNIRNLAKDPNLQ